MAANVRFSNPKTLAKPPGYSYVVEATGPNRLIFIAGQLGLDLEKTLVGSPGEFPRSGGSSVREPEDRARRGRRDLQGRGQDQQLSRRHVGNIGRSSARCATTISTWRRRPQARRSRSAIGAAGRAVRDRGDRGAASEGCESGEGETGRTALRQQGQGAQEAQVGTVGRFPGLVRLIPVVGGAGVDLKRGVQRHGRIGRALHHTLDDWQSCARLLFPGPRRSTRRAPAEAFAH